jgi:hypothetical protein
MRKFEMRVRMPAIDAECPYCKYVQRIVVSSGLEIYDVHKGDGEPTGDWRGRRETSRECRNCGRVFHIKLE